jgi:DNA ligase 1
MTMVCVMAKSLDAPYECGHRDARWLKIKRAHTLDLIVLAPVLTGGKAATCFGNSSLSIGFAI